MRQQRTDPQCRQVGPQECETHLVDVVAVSYSLRVQLILLRLNKNMMVNISAQCVSRKVERVFVTSYKVALKVRCTTLHVKTANIVYIILHSNLAQLKFLMNLQQPMCLQCYQMLLDSLRQGSLPTKQNQDNSTEEEIRNALL